MDGIIWKLLARREGQGTMEKLAAGERGGKGGYGGGPTSK